MAAARPKGQYALAMADHAGPRVTEVSAKSQEKIKLPSKFQAPERATFQMTSFSLRLA
jgi:hypothetical protein